MKDEQNNLVCGTELDRHFWTSTDIDFPAEKVKLTIRLDSDIVAWFKSYGKGYQTKINQVLRSYYEAHRERKN